MPKATGQGFGLVYNPLENRHTKEDTHKDAVPREEETEQKAQMKWKKVDEDVEIMEKPHTEEDKDKIIENLKKQLDEKMGNSDERKERKKGRDNDDSRGREEAWGDENKGNTQGQNKRQFRSRQRNSKRRRSYGRSDSRRDNRRRR